MRGAFCGGLFSSNDEKRPGNPQEASGHSRCPDQGTAAQVGFSRHKGCQATPQGTHDLIRDYLWDHGLLGFYEVTLTDGKITVRKNRQVLAWENIIDGVLMIETTDLTLSAEKVIRGYKELADIQRDWRARESTLLLRPVYHWTEKPFWAHVFVCVLALQGASWIRRKLEP